MKSAIGRALREQVEQRDQGRCGFCHLQQRGQVATFHVDHILPRSAGGPTSFDNLALLCPHCNLHKAGKIAGTDPKTGASTRLFHPLQDQWDDHFEASPIDGRCEGRTAIGRTTVAALKMNDELARLARLAQHRLGVL